MLQQETPDDFGLTVDELVGMGRTPHQRPFDAETADDRRIVESALRDVGLVERRAQRFASLSGGEKQRALLAAHSLSSPNCCCSTNRPTISTCAISSNCSRACGLGIATLATIHDLNLAAAYCDWLHVLAHGRVVASGVPADVLTEALLRDVFGVAALVDRHPVTGRPRITPLHPE